MAWSGKTYQTMVGYFSPPGHDHDDNCRRKIYTCQCGNEQIIYLRNKCPACDWKGKKTCFCHEGEKVEA